MHLYEIIKGLAALEHELEELQWSPEIPEEHTERLYSELNALGLSRAEKLGNIGRMLRNLDSDCNALRAEEQKLKEKRQRIEHRAEWLKGYVSICLSGEKWTDGVISFSFRRGESVLLTVPEEQVPEEYQRVKVTREPDKASIKQSLKEGIELPFAVLKVEQHLQVK